MKSSLQIALLLFCQFNLAPGWGDVGHRTVAYVAQNYFTEDGSDLLRDTLPIDKDFDLSDAATWADEQKRRRPDTRPWHYVDVEDDPLKKKCDMSLMDCPDGDCIISVMEDMTRQMNKRSANHTEAILFLFHFIGDLHMPLHVEGYGKGGNNVSEVQRIWDTDIPHKRNGIKHYLKHNAEKTASYEWAKDLIKQNGHRPARVTECDDVRHPRKCFEQWASESNRLNCAVVFARGLRYLKTEDLAGEYYEDAVPVIEEQIFKAGIRLAAWINSLAAKRQADTGFVVQGDGYGEL